MEGEILGNANIGKKQMRLHNVSSFRDRAQGLNI